MFGCYYIQDQRFRHDQHGNILTSLSDITSYIKTCILHSGVVLINTDNDNSITYSEGDVSVPCSDRELLVRTVFECKSFVIDANRVFAETPDNSPMLIEVMVRSTDHDEFVEIRYRHFLMSPRIDHESHTDSDQYQTKVRAVIYNINSFVATSPVTLESSFPMYINKWFDNSYQRKDK